MTYKEIVSKTSDILLRNAEGISKLADEIKLLTRLTLKLNY